jgi:hypothetical protein
MGLGTDEPASTLDGEYLSPAMTRATGTSLRLRRREFDQCAEHRRYTYTGAHMHI